MKISWIGAGIMGSRMAANLAKANFSITIWNRSKESPNLKYALDAGCQQAITITDALKDSDIIFSCLSDQSVLEDIFSEENISHINSGSILVDCSTVGKQVIKRINQKLDRKNVTLIDAPVTGGDIGAEAGTLTFMVGGNSNAVEKVRPLLEVMGSKIVYAGELGSGQSLKLINQLLCAINLEAINEAFQAARSLGISEAMVVEACSGGAAGSWQLANLGPKIVAGDDSPGFKVEHLSKDLDLLADEIANSKIEQTCFQHVKNAFSELKKSEKAESGTQVLAITKPL